MSIHIWAPRASDSACMLRDAVRALGTKCYKSRTAPVNVLFLNRIRSGDLWINWGSPYTGTLPEGVRQLNNVPRITKFDQLVTLNDARIAAPMIYASPAADRVGRSLFHQGGTDILHGTGHAYYTQRLHLAREFRIHIFQGVSIRAGLKQPRVADPHPWVRSWEGGWALTYGVDCQNAITNAVRNAAKTACVSLGLDFGAVDVGVATDGRVYVLEVNLAPGLEGYSVDAYAIKFNDLHNT